MLWEIVTPPGPKVTSKNSAPRGSSKPLVLPVVRAADGVGQMALVGVG